MRGLGGSRDGLEVNLCAYPQFSGGSEHKITWGLPGKKSLGEGGEGIFSYLLIAEKDLKSIAQVGTGTRRPRGSERVDD